MMKRFLFALLIFPLIFLGGTEIHETKKVPSNSESISASQQIPQDPAEEIYEKAVENFLPLLDSFSKARSFNPEYIMIHFTSAAVLSPNDPYNQTAIRNIFIENEVSIHYIIQRNGTVECWVPENRVAWHAGKGTFAGNEKYTNKMNEYAIGIELVAFGSEKDMSIYLTPEEYSALDPALMGFTKEQYASLRELVCYLCEKYNIPFSREYVIGHEEYSPHKNDPGELFRWNLLMGEM